MSGVATVRRASLKPRVSPNGEVGMREPNGEVGVRTPILNEITGLRSPVGAVGCERRFCWNN